jgi:hypothetical protein
VRKKETRDRFEADNFGAKWCAGGRGIATEKERRHATDSSRKTAPQKALNPPLSALLF